MVKKAVDIVSDPKTSLVKKLELLVYELLKRVSYLIPLNAFTAMQYVITQATLAGKDCVRGIQPYLWGSYSLLVVIASGFAVLSHVEKRL